MADTITYDLHDGIAQITLDDGKVNAMALPFFEGLGPRSIGRRKTARAPSSSPGGPGSSRRAST